ncbi:MAG TPA: hypothetical protein VGS41_15175, partial [Chthonomonadales bacterium]|nr:hypothetical protein [Chthonomonadales bacterium]
MSRWLHNLAALRNSSSLPIRIAWWAIVIGAPVALMLRFAVLDAIVTSILVLSDLVLLTAASIWGALHMRSVWKAREFWVKWAFWISIPATLGIVVAL